MDIISTIKHFFHELFSFPIVSVSYLWFFVEERIIINHQQKEIEQNKSSKLSCTSWKENSFWRASKGHIINQQQHSLDFSFY